MRRPCKTIDTTVLAATVRVQRDLERDIRRRIARKNALRALFKYLRAQGWRAFRFTVLANMCPAVVNTLALVLLVASLKVRDRPSAFERHGRSNGIFAVVRNHGQQSKERTYCINIQ